MEQLDQIQIRRLEIWSRYHAALLPIKDQAGIRLPYIPNYATNNAHMFYLMLQSLKARDGVMSALKKEGIQAVIHYPSLHNSEFYRGKSSGNVCPNADKYSDTLLRLPLYYGLDPENQHKITDKLRAILDTAVAEFPGKMKNASLEGNR